MVDPQVLSCILFLEAERRFLLLEDGVAVVLTCYTEGFINEMGGEKIIEGSLRGAQLGPSLSPRW